MKQKRKWLTYWGIGVLTATLLMIGLYFFTNLHYVYGDDSILLRSLLGYAGGVQESLNYHVHPILMQLAHGLTLVFPTVKWFSVLQLFFLWLVQAVIVKSILQLSTRRGLSLVWGLLLCLFVMAVFIVEFSTSITYTTTTAVLGMGAVLQLFTVDVSARRFGPVFRPLALSVVLLLLSYFLRTVSLYPILAFWVGSCLFLLLQTKRQHSEDAWIPPSFGKAFLLLLCLFGVAGFSHGFLNAFSGEQAYVDWQEARVNVIDYGKISSATAETLTAIGWTEADRELAVNWYLMDSRYSTDALTALAAAPGNETPDMSILGLLRSANRSIRKLFTVSTNAWDFTLLCVLGMAFCLLHALARKERSPWAYLAPLLCVAAVGGMLVYLGALGRLPLRAAATVLLPACAAMLGFALYPYGTPVRHRGFMAPIALVLAACLWVGGTSAKTAYGFYYNPQAHRQDMSATTPAQLEAYALAHPDWLLICQLPGAYSNRLFPLSVREMATNLIVWGNWNLHTPGYRKQLSDHGMNAATFSARDFLREDVRFVSSSPPSTALLTYLAEGTGALVEPLLCEEKNHFSVYRFRLTPVAE